LNKWLKSEKNKKKNKRTKKEKFLNKDIHVSIDPPNDFNSVLPGNSIATASVSTNSTSIKHQKSPQYSCLKNGSIPCYREWKKYNSPLVIEDKPTIQNIERSLKLQEIKNSYQIDNPRKNTRIEKRIKTTTYKLGKGCEKVSVLIKDRGTRKKVQNEQALLRKKNMLEIKNYLRNKNLLKTGSNAPNEVIRQTYEQAILSGDITNKSGGALLHNFLS
jgi:hypothetical protein